MPPRSPAIRPLSLTAGHPDENSRFVGNPDVNRGAGCLKKFKLIVTRTAAELAKQLGLAARGAEIELRSALNSTIIEAVRRKGLTHAQVAALARTSRTSVTAILNRNTQAVCTDLLLRLLYALGYTAKITFKSAA